MPASMDEGCAWTVVVRAYMVCLLCKGQRLDGAAVHFIVPPQARRGNGRTGVSRTAARHAINAHRCIPRQPSAGGISETYVGAGAVAAVDAGLSARGHYSLLGALLIFTALLAPIATAAALRIATE